jgi:Outer membrane protein beta-barrel domain
MMKTILPLLVTILSCQYSFAQKNSFGIKAGAIAASQVKKTDTIANAYSQTLETQTLFSFEAGVFYKREVKTNWMLTAGVNFIVLGSRNKFVTEDMILNPDGKTHYYKDKIGYIELPVMLQYHTGKLFMGFGPGISFRLFSKISDLEPNKSFKTYNYKSLDYGINTLIGYDISKQIALNLRYYYGLANVQKQHQFIRTSNQFSGLSILYCIQ